MAKKQGQVAESVNPEDDEAREGRPSPALKWRPHLQRIMLAPNALGRAEGRVSWSAASGETDDAEWVVLPSGETKKIAGGCAVQVLERFHEDGLRWIGRQMDFHDAGQLVGPIVVRETAYHAPTGLRRRALAEILGLSAIGAATFMAVRADLMPSPDHLAFILVVAAGLVCLSLIDLQAMARTHYWRRASKTEKIGFPVSLNDIVGGPRHRVLTRLIEDGVEQPEA